MAIVKTGSETVVRYGRGLTVIYWVISISALGMALLMLLAGLGEMFSSGSWSDRIFGGGGWLVGAFWLALMAYQLITMAMTMDKCFVAFGPEGLRLELPKSEGPLWVPGKERHFKWEEIGDVSYDKNWRKRECRFRAGEFIYTLSPKNSPSPHSVAKLLAERKGVQLA